MVDIDAPRMVEAGTYSAPISHDAGVVTEVTGAADEQLMEVTQRWEAALEGEKEKAAALEEKVGKWKDRCESLRAELAAVMEKTAETERSLRDRLAKEEKIEGVPKERVEELEGLLHSVGSAGGAARRLARASRKESAAISFHRARANGSLRVGETERLRNEVGPGRRALAHGRVAANHHSGYAHHPGGSRRLLGGTQDPFRERRPKQARTEAAAEASVSVSTPEPAQVDSSGRIASKVGRRPKFGRSSQPR